MTRALCLTLLVFLIGPGLSIAQDKAISDPFWVLSAEKVETDNSQIYVPLDKKFKNQGFLVYHQAPTADSPLQLREVLAELYNQVDDLKILGQKSVPWKEGEGNLVSFSGVHEKKKLLGRAVLANSEQGNEILLLVRHPQADPLLLENFERVRLNWSGDLARAMSPQKTAD